MSENNQAAIDRFVDAVWLEDGLSANTLAAYRRDLTALAQWLHARCAVCGPAVRNRGFLDSDTMHSQWGYHLESEILLLNELKEPEAAQRRALANRLKPIIAAPPEMLVINRKGLHPYEMLNRLQVIAFSNDTLPITLPTRRSP